MRTKGTKNKLPSYRRADVMQAKSKKQSDLLVTFIEQSLHSPYFKPLVDYDLLNKAADHLKEIGNLKIER